jgi:transcriptional regulator with XRE-family HTH domain
MKTIAELLYEGRKRKGLTQFQVMIHLGFKSMDRISKWEHGKGEPSATNLRRLIALYEIPMDQIRSVL